MKYFVINYKTYLEASGQNAVLLTNKLASVDVPEGITLVVCPQAADIYRVREAHPNMEIWAQHVDLIEPGRATGWTSVETLVMAGISGTLVNHSEHLLCLEEAIGTIQLAKEYKLKTCLAVSDALMLEKLMETNPDVVAYEPPELVGTGVSLVEADPKEAAEFAERYSDIQPVLALGAGINSQSDITSALKLGFQGILIASAIVKSEYPEKKLQEMLSAFF